MRKLPVCSLAGYGKDIVDMVDIGLSSFGINRNGLPGDADGIVSASDMEAFAQMLPRSKSATVPNAGHAPMLEAAWELAVPLSMARTGRGVPCFFHLDSSAAKQVFLCE